MTTFARFGSLGFAIASLAALPAPAADYIFAVNYTGGVASLAPASDDPLTTPLVAGDTFTYLLTATDGVWMKTSGAPLFPFFALYVPDYGTRTGDFVFFLSKDGSNVFVDAQDDVFNANVHLGTNTELVPEGLVWDTFGLTYTLLTTDAPTMAGSLLPYFGAPEVTFSGDIGFIADPVPEPSAWMMMVSGFGIVGAAMRRRHRVAVSFG